MLFVDSFAWDFGSLNNSYGKMTERSKTEGFTGKESGYVKYKVEIQKQKIA